MNRFLKTLVVLVVSLFALVSGVDAGLDQLSRSTTRSNYTFYNDKGDAMASYSGDIHACKPVIKRSLFSELHLVHRS